MGRKALFLDRDGVINRKRDGYVTDPGDLEVLEDAVRAMHIARSRGCVVVAVTNQSAVGRGLMTRERLDLVHSRMEAELARAGARLDAIYCCTHAPAEGCACRKPGTALIDAAVRDLDIDAASSWLVGDSDSDMEAARRAGLKGVRVGPDEPFSHLIRSI